MKNIIKISMVLAIAVSMLGIVYATDDSVVSSYDTNNNNRIDTTELQKASLDNTNNKLADAKYNEIKWHWKNNLRISVEHDFDIVTRKEKKSSIVIPTESDWNNQGAVLKAGNSESWDVRLTGMLSPCFMVKKDDTFFLYYIGSDGDRGAPHNDGGPRHRKLGVATSTDGINFVKYSGNPIIEFSPNDNEEEGIFSAGGFLDENGDVILYYGAMDSGSNPKSTQVDGDIRLAISKNGYDFKDIKDVVSHSDSSIWGYGDEIFPIGAFYADDTYHVYYTLGGTYIRSMGMVSGPTKTDLGDSKKVLSLKDRVDGGCNPIFIRNDKIAMFIAMDKWDTGCSTSYIEVRTADIPNPSKLSEPIETYNFGTHDIVVYYNYNSNTWFMYYLDGNTIKLKTA